MRLTKSKSFTVVATLACVACCAVPITTIFAGAASVGLVATLWSPEMKEVVVCFLPLLMIGVGYFIYKRKTRRSCCTAHKAECTSATCSTKDDRTMQ